MPSEGRPSIPPLSALLAPLIACAAARNPPGPSRAESWDPASNRNDRHDAERPRIDDHDLLANDDVLVPAVLRNDRHELAREREQTHGGGQRSSAIWSALPPRADIPSDQAPNCPNWRRSAAQFPALLQHYDFRKRAAMQRRIAGRSKTLNPLSAAALICSANSASLTWPAGSASNK